MNNCLEDDPAIRFNSGNALYGFFHDGVEFVVIGFEDHLLGHKVDAASGNARELADGIFHLRGAVCAIQIFEFKCSFHRFLPPLCLAAKDARKSSFGSVTDFFIENI